MARRTHDISTRIEEGAPNYDRIVRETRFDPLAELQREAIRQTAIHDAAIRRLKELKPGDQHRRAMERRVRQEGRYKTSLLKELAKFGEAKAPTRVTGAGGGPLDVQVSFPWLEGAAE